jgi:hypothetical protein
MLRARDATAAEVRELVAKGVGGGVIFQTTALDP